MILLNPKEHFMYVHDWMYGNGFFMPWVIVFPILLVFVFLMLKRSSGSCSNQHPINKVDEALEIARKRFAKGEIDEETFEKIKQKLS
ncbi:MAG: SHOCT domain-containing protein [Sulfurospirillaceae bacterium]|jgi:putative membrane protein|nr:SHOCT domain-containing protein [Sulfurospirillaceae bacterium]MDD2826721.1 SHOCT domain-containing protein [Sulfurospirillaceae bacterium]